MIFWVCAKVHGTREGIVPADPMFERLLGRATLERALIAGLVVFCIGFALAILSVIDWGAADFQALDPSHSMRLVIPAVTAMLLAVETAYGALFVALLKIQRTPPDMAEAL